jgi:hypothetical protein
MVGWCSDETTFVYVEQGRKGGKREMDLPALGVSLVGDARKNY